MSIVAVSPPSLRRVAVAGAYRTLQYINDNPQVARRAAAAVREFASATRRRRRMTRNTARSRAARNSRFIPRGVRETKQEVQEVHRFLREIDNTWFDHITHPLANFTNAPRLVPNRPNTSDGHKVDFNVTDHLFANTSGVMSPQDCSIDIKGIKFIIELENPDPNNEVYVRTLLLMDKNGAGLGEGQYPDITDELFIDPHDKCKMLDFNQGLVTSGENSYEENHKMKMRINRRRRAVYHDRVIKIGHNKTNDIDANQVQPNPLRAMTNFMYHNKRRLVINWFPRGGFRFKVAMDGNNVKTHMEQRLKFMMFCEKKSFLWETKAYTPMELNYKVKTQIWYKKVY